MNRVRVLLVEDAERARNLEATPSRAGVVADHLLEESAPPEARVSEDLFAVGVGGRAASRASMRYAQILAAPPAIVGVPQTPATHVEVVILLGVDVDANAEAVFHEDRFARRPLFDGLHVGVVGGAPLLIRQ